uniref:Ribosomal RNA-processing protein 14/surfeit locus protein 6 C-terminal domain-containing protein n=1 Tax=Peronospora matthiolae TaxID=2874970 RepID=A0AAV1U0M2_9STRA
MLLGRRLLQASTRVDAQRATSGDATLDTLMEHDRFFCDTMENIPPSFYFPTDAEANWKQSAPRKYHKNVQAQHQRESSKKRVLKRAKFSPAAQQSNEERQQSAAALEQQEKQQLQLPQQLQALDKRRTSRDATSGADGLDGLRARLAVKIQTMREQRHAEAKTGQKRPSRAEVVAEQRSLKKRKSAANRSKAHAETRELEAAASQAQGETQAEQRTDDVSTVDSSSISYGSLLLDEGLDKDKKTPVKTRHGQSVRGIQNLLKKAERNAQRLEELKKTEDGAEKVKAKGWDTALQQAAGKVVLDDPKLLRAKLKKKEKTKAKSSKEWKERVAKLEVSTKERLKKKRTSALGRGKQETAKAGEKKGRKGPRAGFEGKKGEAFLNADKKGSKFAGKTTTAPRK